MRALEERPSLPAHLSIVITAARDLAGDRGVGGYPFAAVAAWCSHVGADVFWVHDRLRVLVEAGAEHGGSD